MLLSIVKSELYRASKFKSLWILTIILFLLMLMTGFTVLKMDMMSMVGMDGEQFDELVSEGNTMDAFQAGLDAGTSSAEENTANVQVNGIDDFKFLGEGYLYRSTVAKFFQVSQASLNGTLLIAIFIGLFAGDVYNTGINKNNIKAMNRKSKILMGRLIVIAIYTFVMHIIHYIYPLLLYLMASDVRIRIARLLHSSTVEEQGRIDRHRCHHRNRIPGTWRIGC